MSCGSFVIFGAVSSGILLGTAFGIFFVVLAAFRYTSGFFFSSCQESVSSSLKSLFFNNSHSRANFEDDEDDRSHIRRRKNTAFRKRESSGDVDMGNDDRSTIQLEESTAMLSDASHVRERIEEFVEKIIGGPLDGIAIGKLSAHSTYLAIFEKYHGLLCRELARLGFTIRLSVTRPRGGKSEASDGVKLNLNRLIRRIIEEAVTFPDIEEILLCRSDGGRQKEAGKEGRGEETCFDGKTYEDILATAILNKVIENVQRERQEKEENGFSMDRCEKDGGRISVGGHERSEPFRSEEKNSLTVEESAEKLSEKLRVADEEILSTWEEKKSSDEKVPFLEPGDFAGHSNGENSDNEEDDDVDSAADLASEPNSWEENWVFQKRRPRPTPNSHHPVPVPMLVPNPSEDFKALIGGVKADDLSDTSECSDSALEDLIDDDGREFDDRENSERSSTEEATEVDSLEEEAEKDSTEKMMEFDGKIARKTGEPDGGRKEEITAVEEEPAQSFRISEIQRPFTPSDDRPPFLGTVAEREKEKWKRAVPLADNPYSAENLGKREREFPEGESSPDKSTAENSKVRRDYYVNLGDDGSPSSAKRSHQGEGNNVSDDCPDRNFNRETPTVQNGNGNGNGETTRRSENGDSFKLPNVRELAKYFASANSSDIRAEGKREKRRKRAEMPLREEKEPNSGTCGNPENFQLEEKGSPSPGWEHVKERIAEAKNREKFQGANFAGKQVHSLTARSISREFREGLKSGKILKIHGDPGEPDAVSLGKTGPSPTPPVDLEKIKKFWEEIIESGRT